MYLERVSCRGRDTMCDIVGFERLTTIRYLILLAPAALVTSYQ